MVPAPEAHFLPACAVLLAVLLARLLGVERKESRSKVTTAVSSPDQASL